MELVFILLSGFNVERIAIFAVIILAIAFLVGIRSKRNGYPFWRTFLMAAISFSSIALLIINMIG